MELVKFTVNYFGVRIGCEALVNFLGEGSNNVVYLIKKVTPARVFPANVSFVLKISKEHLSKYLVGQIVSAFWELNGEFHRGKLMACEQVSLNGVQVRQAGILMAFEQLSNKVREDDENLKISERNYKHNYLVPDIHCLGNSTRDAVLDIDWLVRLDGPNSRLVFSNENPVHIYKVFSYNFFYFYFFLEQKKSVKFIIDKLVEHIEVPSFFEYYGNDIAWAKDKSSSYLPFLWTLVKASKSISLERFREISSVIFVTYFDLLLNFSVPLKYLQYDYGCYSRGNVDSLMVSVNNFGEIKVDYFKTYCKLNGMIAQNSSEHDLIAKAKRFFFSIFCIREIFNDCNWKVGARSKMILAKETSFSKRFFSLPIYLQGDLHWPLTMR